MFRASWSWTLLHLMAAKQLSFSSQKVWKWTSRDTGTWWPRISSPGSGQTSPMVITSFNKFQTFFKTSDIFFNWATSNFQDLMHWQFCGSSIKFRTLTWQRIAWGGSIVVEEAVVFAFLEFHCGQHTSRTPFLAPCRSQRVELNRQKKKLCQTSANYQDVTIASSSCRRKSQIVVIETLSI